MVYLPKAKDERSECEMEIIRNIMIEEFEAYKKKIEKELEKKGNNKQTIDRNQEGENLSKKEKIGLNKLRKRINKGEICVIKTDKSGKITVIKKEDYLKMGNKANQLDRKIERKELKRIESKINDHTRMLVKIFNMGEKNDHLQRILDSKITNSEQSAPKYFMFKDHKEEGGWRPVVSGCSSNTLGLSNLLSEVVESICSAVPNPYEVISSTDMLSRIEKFNEYVRKEEIERKESNPDYEWDWRENWMLLGSDVVSLFPSLSAKNTSEIVRDQVRKSPITWQNIDHTWLRLYIHLNENLIDVSEVKHLLPYKKKGRKGKESGMSSLECKKRTLNMNSPKSCWDWPEEEPSQQEIKILLSLALQIAVVFFFENFVYTFGGECFVQCGGGPIGARLTMALARLVMQAWSEEFSKILRKNMIGEHLRGIYVDDGRNVLEDC